MSDMKHEPGYPALKGEWSDGGKSWDEMPCTCGGKAEAPQFTKADITAARDAALEEAAELLRSNKMYHRAPTKFNLPRNGFDAAYNAAAKDGLYWSEPFTLEQAADAIEALKSTGKGRG